MNNTIMWKEIMEQADAIPYCLSINQEKIAAIAQAVATNRPSQIIYVARGTSDHAATFGKYLMEIECGIPVGLSACSVLTAYQGKIQYQNAMVVAISQSGAGRDVFEVLHAAKEAGALTVAITNEEDSIIAREAAYHLFCGCGEEISVAATKTFIMQLLLVTQLTAAVARKPALLDNIERSARAILARSEEVAALAPRYRFMGECFVLSRGLGYPLAMETALKIQETCYVKAKAYSVADFQHGPFAMVEQNTPVFLIAVDRHTDGDVEATLDRLNSVGADTFVVTNKQAILDKATVGVLLPDWCEGIPGCFAAAAVAQMFASTLALAKGNNPDAPRGLAKVTITR